MSRTVLLLHERPDGTSHLDWMIQREGDSAVGAGAANRSTDGEPALLTFRVAVRIDSGEWGCFLAEQIGEHRAAYLSYEGPVPGGRGRVSRVAEGEVRIETAHEAVFRVAGRLGAAEGVFSGFKGADGIWAFSFDAAQR
jgi:hypothetical protein